MELLLEEAVERKRDWRTTKPALGACIRRLYMDSADEEDLLTVLPDGTRLNPNEKLLRAYYTVLRLSVHGALPNLDSIHWMRMEQADGPFTRTILEAPARYLTIERMLLTKDLHAYFEASPPIVHQRVEGLAIEPILIPAVHSGWPAEDTGRGSSLGHDFVSSLLSSCARTLQHLHWNSMFWHAKREPDSRVPVFPKMTNLRSVELHHLILDADDQLTALLMSSGKLQRLTFWEISCGPKEPLGLFLKKAGYMPQLETFVLHHIGHEDGENVATLLGKNSHLSRLSLAGVQPGFMVDVVVPALRGGFPNLRSLEIGYCENTHEFDAVTLDAISNITTLERLHLHSGQQYGWKKTWKVDHKAVRYVEHPFTSSSP
jgi:hypothetical protein